MILCCDCVRVVIFRGNKVKCFSFINNNDLLIMKYEIKEIVILYYDLF